MVSKSNDPEILHTSGAEKKSTLGSERDEVATVDMQSMRMRRGNAFGRICQCVCLSVCLVRALTFESLDIQTSLLVRRYILISSKSGIKVTE